VRLATIRTWRGTRTRAVRVVGDYYVDLGVADVGTLLAQPDWRAAAASPRGLVMHAAGIDLGPVVPRPGKIVCVGLNYRAHILEMGRDLPQFPALFAKYPEALTGPYDLITLPAESQAPDREAELAVVIGATVRHADAGQAAAAIAGFSVLNDVTMRDWQYRTSQWLQGKTFEATTPFGPVLVTPDELPGGAAPALTLTCRVDGEIVQKADTGDLVFPPAELVRYVSTILTLRPGDVIATGTPGGVGHASDPRRYLTSASLLETEITHVGRLSNPVSAL
jgi:acylpyruvate hydrolase